MCQELMMEHPRMKYAIENVAPKSKFKTGDPEQWNRLVKVPF